MEIVTSLSQTEFQRIITDAVSKVLLDFKPQVKAELPDFLTIEEAVELTGLRRGTIYKHSHEGTIPAMRRGKKLIFSRTELQAWIDDQTVRKVSPAERADVHLMAEASKK